MLAFEEVVVAHVLGLEEAELEVDELLEEHVFGRGDGLVFFEEVVDGSGDKVGMSDEVPVVLHGVEAVLEGIGGGAGLAGGGAWASGFLGVGAVGGQGGFGHGFLARLVGCVRWIVGSGLFFGQRVVHGMSPEQKLAGGFGSLMFGACRLCLESEG